MPQTRTIRTRQEMDQKYFDTLVRLIRSQGYRELAAATVFAEALHLVPGLALKKKVVQHVNEEMEHFEVCCEIHEQIGAGDLEVIASAVLFEKRPIPKIESFLELGIAQFLYDRASAFQLREYENCSFDPYCRIVGKILEEEEGHESFGVEIMVEHSRDPVRRARMQELFDKWLAVSLRSFGRPGTAGNRYAIEAGLKTRDSAAVAQDYLDGQRPVMRLCGIVFPSREELKRLGVETAPDIDLRL
jgi:1,2-phenylacetyl-CoA epoxidase catalytic subunit